jgi:hypothetical protein
METALMDEGEIVGLAGIPEDRELNERGVEINRDFQNFLELASELGKGDPGTLICDVDFVIRFPHKALMSLKFGEIPESSLTALQNLKDKGWKVLFVTNQPREGHQIARRMSRLKGYKAFPEALEDIFGQEAIIGGGADFLLGFSKSRKGTVEDTVGWLQKNGTGRVSMVSDQIRDAEFFKKVYEELSRQGESGVKKDGAMFYKIPGPPIG